MVRRAGGFDTTTGQSAGLARGFAADGPVAVDDDTQRLFAAGASSAHVGMLDARNGALLGTTPVGRPPAAIGVDSHTSRVFVYNEQDATVSILDAGWS